MRRGRARLDRPPHDEQRRSVGEQLKESERDGEEGQQRWVRTSMHVYSLCFSCGHKCRAAGLQGPPPSVAACLPPTPHARVTGREPNCSAVYLRPPLPSPSVELRHGSLPPFLPPPPSLPLTVLPLLHAAVYLFLNCVLSFVSACCFPSALLA